MKSVKCERQKPYLDEVTHYAHILGSDNARMRVKLVGDLDALDLAGQSGEEPVFELDCLGVAQTARVPFNDHVVLALVTLCLLLDAGELFATELVELENDLHIFEDKTSL